MYELLALLATTQYVIKYNQVHGRNLKEKIGDFKEQQMLNFAKCLQGISYRRF